MKNSSILAHLPGEHGPHHVEAPDPSALERHRKDQDSIGDSDQRQRTVPEPEEDKDLLGNDVWGKDADVPFPQKVLRLKCKNKKIVQLFYHSWMSRCPPLPNFWNSHLVSLENTKICHFSCQ